MGWSPAGNLIASYSGADGWIKVWNAKTGQLIWNIVAKLLKPDEPLKSPDGALLASGVKGESYRIRDAESGKLIWTIKAASTSPERVTSPDGSMNYVIRISAALCVLCVKGTISTQSTQRYAEGG